MLKDWKFWLLTIFGALALVISLFNLSIRSSNRDRQAEVVQRQQFINESIQLSRFNSQFIQALAQLSAQTNDESIRTLLAQHGVTFKVNTPPPESADVETVTNE